MSSARDSAAATSRSTPDVTRRMPKAPQPKRDGLSARTSSIARSIALSTWGRRLACFVVLDILLLAAFLATFVWTSIQSLPPEARGTGALPTGIESLTVVAINEPSAPQPAPPLGGWGIAIQAHGVAHTFEATPYLPMLYGVGGTLLVAEAFSLLSGLGEARRIRRKLRPLNELALTAEALAARADEATAAEARSASKFESLEHAIEHTSVDAPQVATGDKDLRSIEVALNGLLRRMQDAKAQQARFVSDASHELRTPIAVIEGYVGMLDRWGKTDPQVLEESIEALKGESAHMRELVEQLLFLARGDSGRNSLERSQFDAAVLLGEVARESQLIDACHTYLVREYGCGTSGAGNCDGDAVLIADRAMVKQCLRVIVQNAARYSPADTTVTLRLRRDETGGRLGLEVEDEGVGMAEQDARHVFDRFWRADAARNGHREGTGLGLSIAKWIADAHGGAIEVVSCEGVGTRFTVWLPM